MTDEIRDDIRRAAFRRLFTTRRPVSAEELSADLGHPVQDVTATIADMGRQGQLRLSHSGRVIGSAGLSVEPDRHQMDIEGRRYWTWCTYDILGIFGALHADGTAHSSYPTGFEIRFQHGRPQSTNLFLFLPEGDPRDTDCCANTYEQWCPNANLFNDEEEARAWSQTHGVSGRIVSIRQAGELASEGWAPLVAGLAV